MEKATQHSIGLFAGVALMEETTAIRLDWRRTSPEGGDAVQVATLRVIYSMGPHKAHQFLRGEATMSNRASSTLFRGL